MSLVVLILILILLLGGFGALLKGLWWLAVILVALAIIGGLRGRGAL